jgi:8-oxo-dGTP pyrophosphatase MutT (NUDIX family)
VERGQDIGQSYSAKQLLDDPAALRLHVIRTLHKECSREILFKEEPQKGVSSGVMLLLGRRVLENRKDPEICIILNKRSRKVKQSGDLCCPGGTVEATRDHCLAKILTLPGFPLKVWPYWADFRRRRPHEALLLSLMLATGLRESWEEMRLNPLFVRFLGPLPSQRLLLFHRIIYPMVGWVGFQKWFRRSWEVEEVLWIPLRSLMNRAYYVRYRLYVPPHLERKFNRTTQDLPAFLYTYKNRTELLWGATYRIVANFIRLIFGFRAPELTSLPLIPGVLDEGYIYGRE